MWFQIYRTPWISLFKIKTWLISPGDIHKSPHESSRHGWKTPLEELSGSYVYPSMQTQPSCHQPCGNRAIQLLGSQAIQPWTASNPVIQSSSHPAIPRSHLHNPVLQRFQLSAIQPIQWQTRICVQMFQNLFQKFQLFISNIPNFPNVVPVLQKSVNITLQKSKYYWCFLNTLLSCLRTPPFFTKTHAVLINWKK